MKVEFYGHVRQYHNIKSEIDANIREVLESGQYVMGPMLKRFEGELAKYHGTKFAAGLGNGTDAIWLALMALGIGPGAQMQQPLAIMVIGGLTANMLFTRLVIPVGYLVIEGEKGKVETKSPVKRALNVPLASAPS